MFYNFGYEVSIILKKAEKERYVLRHPYVGTEHLMLALLSFDEEVRTLAMEYGVTYDDFRQALIDTVGMASKATDINLYTPMLKEVIEIAGMEAKDNNKGVILPIHLFKAILEEGEGIAYRIFLEMDVPTKEMYQSVKKTPVSRELSNKNLEILKIGVRMNDVVKMREKVVGRDKEMGMLCETLLRRQKNNPLLIGKAGVGKTALVEELVRRIKNKSVPIELQNMEVISLEMGSLVAGTKYRGEFEERLNKIIKEVIKEQNIILFIDEIHTMVNAGGAEGAIAASDILKPYLARGDIKIIGATTLEEYHEFIEKDRALDRRFERILIEEPNEEDMMEILKAVKPTIENHYKVCITEENLHDFYVLSEEYLFTKCNPDKTIELIDSVCARIRLKNCEHTSKSSLLKAVKKRKEKCIKNGDFEMAMKEANLEHSLKSEQDSNEGMASICKDDILEVIESKTKALLRVPFMERFELLKKKLSENVLGQEEAIQKILDVLWAEKRKGTSFLLVGGSGVGKTLTVKVFSDVLKMNLLRIDMSEYSSLESVHRLIGAPPGYVGYQEPYVLETLREQPFTTVLFDEIEKAHPQVLNLLLQILDEGFVTDSRGNKIRFDHTYIFLTSNAQVKKSVGFATSAGSNFDGVFSKELLGRIDAVVEYQSITREVALEFIEKELKNPKIKSLDLICEGEIERYGLRHIRNLILKYNKQAEYQEN